MRFCPSHVYGDLCVDLRPLEILTRHSTLNTFLNAWVFTNHKFDKSTFNSATIYGRSSESGAELNSFLEEVRLSYADLEKNYFYSRIEVLQRTPGQLELNVIGSAEHPEWIEALALGYERSVRESKALKVFTGASVTQSYIPTTFKVSSYGENPISAEVHVRMVFSTKKGFGKILKSGKQ